MSFVQTQGEIEYPESDGKPMGETDIHLYWMIRVLDTLQYRYRGERVYLSSDLLVYYEEGNPRKFVVPDAFVVLDCEPGFRRTFKIWEEGKTPDVIFEVTSRSTRREDEVAKPEIYARLGVKEYFLYDPTAEYLKPPLRGFRCDDSEFVRIEPDSNGMLRCETLGITLKLDGGQLVMCDTESGKVLTTAAEAEEAARLVAERARESAESERDSANARTAELEAEIQRLREELGRKRDES